MAYRIALVTLLLAVTPVFAQDSPSFQSYSKFDFVPGEKIVAIEDFLQDAIGDFPGK